jgi:predicted permease
MTVYASTALFVVLIFDQLFQFSFFITLLLIFIAFRQNSQLNDELMRRMMQHQMRMQEQEKKEQDPSLNEEQEEEDDKLE